MIKVGDLVTANAKEVKGQVGKVISVGEPNAYLVMFGNTKYRIPEVLIVKISNDYKNVINLDGTVYKVSWIKDCTFNKYYDIIYT